MNKLTAVFWDVDGTIADTEICGHRVAFNRAFKDFDLDWYWSKNAYIDLLKISGGLNRIIHYRNDTNSNITDEVCDKIQSRKRFYYKGLIQSGNIIIREGVLRLIDELASFGVKQFIVTTSGRKSLEPFLNASMKSYLKYFSQIITYEDVCNHKPFPDAYNLAIKLSNESLANCLAIEDSIIGVESTRAAKLNCLLTLPPWSSSVSKINKNANSCVDSLGSNEKYSKLIYGKPLINNIVDYEYLTNIIN